MEQRKALEAYCRSAPRDPDSPELQHALFPSSGPGTSDQGSETDRAPLFPHNLNMTATPIPRTLAMTLYGDQDISVISEYPAGRKPIFTRVIKDDDRDQVYRFIEEEIRSGRQVYWISPLVEESETLDIANATQMREHLAEIFPDFTI